MINKKSINKFVFISLFLLLLCISKKDFVTLEAAGKIKRLKSLTEEVLEGLNRKKLVRKTQDLLDEATPHTQWKFKTTKKAIKSDVDDIYQMQKVKELANEYIDILDQKTRDLPFDSAIREIELAHLNQQEINKRIRYALAKKNHRLLKLLEEHSIDAPVVERLRTDIVSDNYELAITYYKAQEIEKLFDRRKKTELLKLKLQEVE